MPLGHSDDEEARLDVHGSSLFGQSQLWHELRSWWVKHNGRTNTPNWDIASDCDLAGRRGLVLVEAKANARELKPYGKELKPTASWRSTENHERIGKAISEASSALTKVVPGVTLSRDARYQLANRVALSWKIASSGMPVVLLYLGFTGDKGIANVGEPFRDQAHWNQVFEEHAHGVLPAEFLEREIDCEGASMHLLVRSRPVLELSRAN
jgi:hypothetical protein